MGNSASFDKRTIEQEKYVYSKFDEVKSQLQNGRYSDNQIKAKLRLHYHGNKNNDDYILRTSWNNVKL